ncbi:hypothetical protein EVAR_30803_1 [Eumeta japonica]|uniref:Uncharacterized protein n=1 Tax=Eumeta variegata TaxID=151549 RepID=A0A4C1V6J0_EUMVA|nr:hypothetical protein EVAR_30803_1 [Eumeta japonica]
MSLCSRGSTRWPPIGRERPRFLRGKEIASTFGRECERDVTPSPPTAGSAEHGGSTVQSSTTAPFLKERTKPSVPDISFASTTTTAIRPRSAVDVNEQPECQF